MKLKSTMPILLIALLLSLSACDGEADRDAVGVDPGIREVKNPVYRVKEIEEDSGADDVLYVMTRILPAPYQESIDLLMDGEYKYGRALYQDVTQGPAIAVFQHEEYNRDPEEPSSAPILEFLVPLLDSSSGRIRFVVPETVFLDGVGIPDIDNLYPVQLQTIAHLTSPEEPLYVAINGVYVYYVIGDTAYTFDGTPGLDYLPELVTDGVDIEVAAIG